MKTFEGGLYGLSKEASFFLGLSERTVERYISKFLVTSDVKSEIIGLSYEATSNVSVLIEKSVSFFFVFGVKNSQTTFFEIAVYNPLLPIRKKTKTPILNIRIESKNFKLISEKRIDKRCNPNLAPR